MAQVQMIVFFLRYCGKDEKIRKERGRQKKDDKYIYEGI